VIGARRYPPPPWRLAGDLYGAVFAVRSRDLTGFVPPRHRLVSLAGRTPAVLVWAAYHPGGVLSYRELAFVLPTLRGWRLRATVPRIWVDSVASRDGGRELWAIPKELASLEFTDGSARAVATDGRDLALCAFRAVLRLPGRWPVRFSLAQADNDSVRRIPVRVIGRVELGRARIAAPVTGPLTSIAGRRPLLAAALRRSVLSFGEAAVEMAGRKAFNCGS
jgi:Acetoacetate decarboxylase (ADC)